MSRWPLVPLRALTKAAVRPVSVEPNTSYPLLGVRTKGNGPFLRETKTGAEIAATRLFRVAVGDFIYSRLFAWQGAFGVISAELDESYVSNEFPLFEVDHERLSAQYLNYWFRLPTTLRLVEKDCTGSTPLTRNRYKEHFFNDLRIPLPPLDVQTRFVARLHALNHQLEARESTSEAIATEISAFLRSAFSGTVANARFLPMSEIAPLVRREIEVDLDGSYPELGIRSFGKGAFHKPPLSGVDVGSKRLFRIQEGDLLFNIVFAWEGAVAVAQPEDDGRVGSHRFLTCVPDPTRATSEFLRYYFLTPEGLEKLGKASPGGAGRNRTLGIKALEAIEVPVPSFDAQLWFDALQAKAAQVRAAHAEASVEADQLIPSLLDRAFAA